MKKNLILAILPILILTLLFYTKAFYSLIPAEEEANSTVSSLNNQPKVSFASHRTPATNKNKPGPVQEEIVSNALSLIGSPYVYAGTSPNGFDCSGFITHVYSMSGIDLPHSSAMQAEEGIFINKHEAKSGDLVIFTGTNADVREPGHVGIVISEPGDTISFVHASSNGGVKISKVEGSRYDLRFLEIRRVL